MNRHDQCRDPVERHNPDHPVPQELRGPDRLGRYHPHDKARDDEKNINPGLAQNRGMSGMKRHHPERRYRPQILNRYQGLHLPS